MTTLKHVFWTLLLFCTTSLLAATWTDENGVEWTYTISDGVVTIGDGSQSAISTKISGEITIPTEIGGYEVRILNSYAFFNCTAITKVVLPSSIKTIGERAFSFCTNLKLIIPGTGKSIGEGAFIQVPEVQFEEDSSSGITKLSVIGWSMGDLPSVSCLTGAVSYIRYTSRRYVSVSSLYLPKTVVTDVSFTSGTFGEQVDLPFSVDTLYIKGPYRELPNLFAACKKIVVEDVYAEEWERALTKEKINRSRLSVVSTLHGGTTSDRGRYVTWGEEVSVTARAKEGYVFLGWDSDREGIEGTEETITFTMPQAPVTLVANFFPKALLEGWMDTRIDAKVDGERLMTADQAAEKTAAAIEGKVESGELFTPAGAEAKAAEEIAQKVANKELITADSLQEMALDAPVIEVDASGTAKVGISLQKASSLSGDWEEVALAEDAASVSAGALKLAVPAEEGTAFYKFVVPARQGAQEP